MSVTRRALLGAGATAVVAQRQRFCAQASANSQALRIGVLTDLSGPYRDLNGQTSIVCVRQAVNEITKSRAIDVVVLVADHQNKPEVGAGIARQWFDREGVDAVVNLPNSALALAVSNICREKNKVMLVTSAATSELTGKQCSPNTVDWALDTWMVTKSTTASLLKSGEDTWSLIAPDYAFGHQLASEASRFISEGGDGRVASPSYS